MTSEEMMFELTKLALRELLSTNQENILGTGLIEQRRQKEIGDTAANLARHAYVKMVLNLHDILNYE